MKKAFTLIELLIVVAIIAILAAIAVPNFLEAQTRAKISRVQSDQRTYATALETYYIDNNSYPVYYSTGMQIGAGFPYTVAVPNVNKNFNMAIKSSAGQPEAPYDVQPSFAVTNQTNGTAIGLTTPVSYLSTYVADTFADYKGATFNYVQGSAGYLLWSWGADGKDQLDQTNSAEYIINGGVSLPSPFLIAGPVGVTQGKPANGGSGTEAYTYDATNGTGSTGDVYRTK